jgi:hypothetical protein
MTVPKSVQPQTFLRIAAVAFLLGWGLHVIDHPCRGMSASPMFIMVGGMVQGTVVVIAITMALRGHNQASEAATFTSGRHTRTVTSAARASTSPGSRGSLPSPRSAPACCSPTRAYAREEMPERQAPQLITADAKDAGLQVGLCIVSDWSSLTPAPHGQSGPSAGGRGKHMPGAVVLPQTLRPTQRRP